MYRSDKHNLNQMELATYIRRMTKAHFKADIEDVTITGKGYYATIIQIKLCSAPHAVILKCHRSPGWAKKEIGQLRLLKAHSQIPVPHVYAHVSLEQFSWEAIFMEYIHGVPVSDVVFPTKKDQNSCVDRVIQNLKHLHSITNPAGFGGIAGPYDSSWKTCYKRKIQNYYAQLTLEPASSMVSPYIRSILDESYGLFDLIFTQTSSCSSLVHGDYTAWNILVDPKTFKPSAILDPMDGGWADYEIDLFNLVNCRPELGLLERYLAGTKLDDSFWIRFYFYWLWDDIKHYLRIAFYNEALIRRSADKLKVLMCDLQK